MLGSLFDNFGIMLGPFVDNVGLILDYMFWSSLGSSRWAGDEYFYFLFRHPNLHSPFSAKNKRTINTTLFGEFGRWSRDLCPSDYDLKKFWDNRWTSLKGGMWMIVPLIDGGGQVSGVRMTRGLASQ